MWGELFKKIRKISAAPRPFPGKYPTRIRINVEGENKPIYMGRPTPVVRDFIGNRYFRTDQLRSICVAEFDQNGLIRELADGRITKEASFAPMYYFLPSFVHASLPIKESTFVFLDRMLVSGKHNNVYGGAFFQGTPWEETSERMARDASRGKIGKHYFAQIEELPVLESITRRCLKMWPPEVLTAIRTVPMLPPVAPATAGNAGFDLARLRDIARDLQQVNAIPPPTGRQAQGLGRFQGLARQQRAGVETGRTITWALRPGLDQFIRDEPVQLVRAEAPDPGQWD